MNTLTAQAHAEAREAAAGSLSLVTTSPQPGGVAHTTAERDPFHPAHPANLHLPVYARWVNYIGAAHDDAARYLRVAQLAQAVLGMRVNKRNVRLMRDLAETIGKDGLPRGWEQLVYYVLSCANSNPNGDREQFLRAVIARREGTTSARNHQNRPLAGASAAYARMDAEARATMQDPAYDHIKRPPRPARRVDFTLSPLPTPAPTATATATDKEA